MSEYDSEEDTPDDDLEADTQVTTADGQTVPAKDILAQAEANLAEVIADLSDWADDDMREILEACSAAENDPDNRQKYFETIFSKAHNLKGLGGSFGFDLVTEIGGSLCDYLRGDFTGDFETVSLHVKSLKLVLDQEMLGDGGEEGRALVGGLRELAVKK